MIKQLITFGAAIAMGATTIIPATPAFARDGYYQRGDHYRGDYRGNRGYGRGDYYRADRNYNRGYRGNYRGCDSGTGGTIIGAIAGGLLGHEVVGRRGDQTAGAIVGAGVGALAGRAIDRSGNSRRC